MARIELRHCDINIKDGLAGTAAVNQPTTAPVATDDDLTIDSVLLNTVLGTMVPIGARFTIAGETLATQVHVVQTRTPPTAGPTTAITFSPPLGPGTYADGAVLTFKPNQITVKIGDGKVDYTEARQMEYQLDRGDLDTVREKDQVPVDVNLDFNYEHVASGTSEQITPVEALKRKGNASEWVSAADDKCEPFAVLLEIVHNPPCGAAQRETTVLADYRYEKLAFDFKAATISTSGKCNVTEAEVTRG
jgi:hypothetical protein